MIHVLTSVIVELKLKLRESARIRGAGVESKSSSEVSNGGRGR